MKRNFLTDIIDADLEAGRHTQVVTRFPPEPNGYLHIGHAKSIWLNYGLSQQYGGNFNLRFDDTNPTAEDEEFVQGILRDVRWLLGLESIERVFWASDYFDWLYERAQELVQKGLAYVDSQTLEQVRENRGDFTTPGVASPDRDRSTEENLDLLERMRTGEFADGTLTLRAKIDMAHPNMVMRDPLLYRIKHAHHHNTGDKWCIYPMYDFAHCLEDAYEGISHSICTLEFENNRDVYDWLLENVTWNRFGDKRERPRQYEFARLSLDYTLTSKRKLRQLVEDRHVDGWNDPRMPTLVGLRRAGVRAQALRDFADLIGVAKTNSLVDIGKFEYAIRNDLNAICPRVLAVLDPVRVTLTNVDDDFEQAIDAPLWPNQERAESRTLHLRKHILIDRTDFEADPIPGYKRLSPGATVRLRYAGAIRCDEVVRDADGSITELRCTLLEGEPEDVGGILHWLSEKDAVAAEVRVYDRLFSDPAPGGDPNTPFVEQLNPASLVVHAGARVEPWLAEAARSPDAIADDEPALRVQFERIGYFCPDTQAPGSLVFNRIVGLKDSWARQHSDDDVDLDALRAEKEREKAEQTARSTASRRSAAELAAERGPEVAARFQALVALGTPEGPALTVASASEQAAAYLQGTDAFGSHPAETAKYFVNYTLPAWDDAAPYPADAFSAFALDLATGVIHGGAAKTLHATLLKTGAYDPSSLEQVDDSALAKAIDAVLAKESDAVERYKGGKVQLLGFFVGKVMAATRGSADANEVRTDLLARLNA